MCICHCVPLNINTFYIQNKDSFIRFIDSNTFIYILFFDIFKSYSQCFSYDEIAPVKNI